MPGFLGKSPLSAFSNRRWRWPAFAAVSLAYVALYLHLPVAVLADARLDDGWYFGRAHDLAAGRWLGPYSQVTLMRGPGYPLFLAFCYALGVSAILAQAVLNVAASALFARAVWRIGACWPLAAAVFAACLWHPYLFPTRVIRDDIYAAQTLIYLACLLRTLTASGRTARLAWPIAAGLSLAWLWITREEGVWVVPASLVMCAAVLWRDRSRLADLARAAVAAAAAFAVLAGVNFAVYRTPAIEDFKGGTYARAIDAVQSVRVGDPVAYAPVPGKVRERLYAVSPAFASLRPYLEGDGRVWMTPGCRVYPSTCGDYAGGWFVWALRDAVAAQGLYNTPGRAAAFYRNLAREVRVACKDGRLTCRRSPVSLMPAVTPAQWRTAPSKARELASLLLVREPRPEPEASHGDPVELRVMWDFVGLPRRTPAEGERLASVQGEIDGEPGLRLQARCGAAVFAAQSWPDSLRQAFEVRFPADAICRLQSAGAGAADPGVSFDSLPPGRRAILAGRTIRFGAYAKASDVKAETAALRVLGAIDVIYRRLAQGVLVLAVVAWLAHLAMLVRGRGRIDAYWWITHALWLLLASRAAVLVLVDISSFPGVTIPYLSAAFPLAFAAALMTIGLVVRAVWPPKAESP